MDRSQPATRLRLAEVVAALSLATDLGTGQPMERGIRTCLVAVRLGQLLGLGTDELADAYYLPLLAMLGCTASIEGADAVFGDELAFGARVAPLIMGERREMLGWLLRHFAEEEPLPRRGLKLGQTLLTMPRVMPRIGAIHCEVAQFLADRLGFGAGLALGLGAIYARWDGRGMPRSLKGEAIPLPARLMHLAWDLQLFHRLGGRQASVEIARRRAGHAFDPTLVDHLCQHPADVLEVLDAPSLWEAVLAAEPGTARLLPDAQLDPAATVFADFADLKSVYTHGHSRHVAALAGESARRYGLGEAIADDVRRAGLVHDLGRVAISSGVWDKPGPLSDAEWERVRLHPYYTERILARARPLAPLAGLAGAHHERLDGSGYHRGVSASSLTPAARILAAADVYAALTEPRPHRPARSSDQAADELRREVRAGRLDGEAVQAVLAAAGHRVRRVRRDWPAGLSEREVEVLRLAAQGLTNRQMAERLAISKETANNHVRHIYAKIGVSTRAAAALFAMQHDLLGDLRLAEQ